MFSLFGAVLLFDERPALVEWCGIGIILGGYVSFALIGRREGIRLRANRWLILLVGGTLVGAGSGLYDRWLFREQLLARKAIGLAIIAAGLIVLRL